MPTFQRCPEEVNQMGAELMFAFETHAPLIHAKVTIDYVFAYADVEEETGKVKGHALTKNGIKALGQTRKIALKDRALGRADCEIAIDADWWATATNAQRRALLDHELHHVSVRLDGGGFMRDDLSRPVIKLRKHDYEFGWFRCIAERHGACSQEQIGAAEIMEESGQMFWPAIAQGGSETGIPVSKDAATVEIRTSNGKSTGPVPLARFSEAVEKIHSKAK